jgi:predicted RNA polymerase sigma factor
MPASADRAERISALLRVLYLIFNEGYTASSGSALQRVELTAEAIRLTRQLRAHLPDDGEVAGLLALMLLTDARRPARTRPDGALVPLAEQDRRQWDTRTIAEGVNLITATPATAAIGPYQLQAAIAALHDEATHFEDTDWRQILALYELLDSVAPGPMVTLNRIVAAAMVSGPEAGLSQLAAAEADPALAGHHRVDAVTAHLLDIAGDHEAARVHYALAARRTLSTSAWRGCQEPYAAQRGRSGGSRPWVRARNGIVPGDADQVGQKPVGMRRARWPRTDSMRVRCLGQARTGRRARKRAEHEHALVILG